MWLRAVERAGSEAGDGFKGLRVVGAGPEFFIAAFAVIAAGDRVLHSGYSSAIEQVLAPDLECQRALQKKQHPLLPQDAPIRQSS